MQKICFFIFTISLLSIYCSPKNKGTEPINKTEENLPVNAVTTIIKNYIILKDAFVKLDTILLTKAIQTLIENTKQDSITITTEKAKNDNILIAIKDIHLLSNTLQSKTTIEAKLLVFKDITNPMQQILKLYNPTTLYVQHCSMANDYSADKKVYWISKDGEEKIRNPFYPKKMLECGSVTDTLETIK